MVVGFLIVDVDFDGERTGSFFFGIGLVVGSDLTFIVGRGFVVVDSDDESSTIELLFEVI